MPTLLLPIVYQVPLHELMYVLGVHDFRDLLTIALYAVLAGGENATDTAEFAKAKEPFLRAAFSAAGPGSRAPSRLALYSQHQLAATHLAPRRRHVARCPRARLQ